MKKIAFASLLLIFSTSLYAAIPVAVMPFEGDKESTAKLETRVKDILIKTDGISVVADRMMDKIIKLHEEAQTIGSGYQDLSNLKIASFLITGNVSGSKLTLKAIDVNDGTEIYSNTIDVSGENAKYTLKRAVGEISDKIILQAASAGGEIPADAKPYMKLINDLAASLGNGDSASYRYVGIYMNGAYIHPVTDKDKKKSAENIKPVLQLMRQTLLRAKISYVSMKGESPWVYISIVANKAGKKIKARLGILELEDGSMAVCLYEEGV